MVMWFLWAFWTSIAPLCSVPIVLLFGCLHPKCGQFMGGLLSTASTLSSLAVIVTGMVWRWNVLGEVASGALLDLPKDATEEQIASFKELAEQDYGTQWASGKFMNIYLLIVFWLVVVMLSCCAVGAIVVCAKR